MRKGNRDEESHCCRVQERSRPGRPVISKAISDLEHTLGVRLLERSPQGVEPTVYGRALLDRGVAAFDELKQAVKHIEFLADPTAGQIRVGASIAMAAGYISAVTDRGRIGEAWRTQRWDSFRMNTFNVQTVMPGDRDNGPDPEGILTLRFRVT